MLTVFCRVSVMDIFSLLQKKHRIMFIYPSLKDKQLLQNVKNTILTKNVKIVFYPIYLELNVCCCFKFSPTTTANVSLYFKKNQQAQIAFFIFLQYHCHCTGCFRFYGFPDKERQNSVLSNLFGAKRLLLL